uniref:Sema domain-containing protein n=1 Tax=Glossina brevipalpis TaxID=37001 RepID=A0A1A9WXA0_9MUSC
MCIELFNFINHFLQQQHNELYSGTVADFSGSDPIIYREPLQTEQYDSLSLNVKCRLLSVHPSHIISPCTRLLLRDLSRTNKIAFDRYEIIFSYEQSLRSETMTRNVIIRNYKSSQILGGLENIYSIFLFTSACSRLTPNFVSSFTQGDFVYFFFRETAVEYINCGKTIYSRVARVCKWDKGGPHRFRNRWTSFLKSRLNCSIPGDFPFYFNEILKSSSLRYCNI